MRTSLALDERERLARKRQPEEVSVDPRLELARRFGNQALARALARQPATLDPAAPQQSEPLKPGIPPWIQALYVQSGVLTPDEATALLNSVGAWGLQRFMICVELERDPIEARRVHFASGSGRAAILDWDKTHPQISPADPNGTKPLKPGYGTLRDVFYRHRAQQLTNIFGVQSLDLVLTAAEVAEHAGNIAAAEKIRDLLFRANQYAIVETLNVKESARYKPGEGKTYCNIYAYDVVTAMGGYLPRVWWTDAAWTKIQAGAEIVSLADLKRMKKDKEDVSNVVAPEYGVTVSEQNANALTAWMHKTGSSQFGWSQASDMDAAQASANQGSIVILLAANKVAKKSGHVSVVLAESNDHLAGRDEATNKVVVPLQSQAGSKNFKYSAESGAPGSTAKKWWEDASHKDGAAWIFGGSIQSPLVAPEEIGVEGLDQFE
jgi:hypothetical protein